MLQPVPRRLGASKKSRRTSAGAVQMGVLRRDADIERLAESIQTTCVGALHQWGAGLIDDAGFRERCALGVGLAFAAAAADRARAELTAKVDR